MWNPPFCATPSSTVCLGQKKAYLLRAFVLWLTAGRLWATFSLQLACALWGLNLWAEALHHTATRCHNTSLTAQTIKTTLTGSLSALVELSRWNVYLYIQIAQCHVMSHNVSWTNNVSHFSIRPAALKPPCSLYSHSKQPENPGCRKGTLVWPQQSASLN